jgi:hypothetical protein
MKFTAKIVGDVLETTLGYRVEMTPLGFDLMSHHELVTRRARLRSGGGIAGNSSVWWLVALPEGRPVIAGNIRTKAKLARAVLEFMAGPPPAPLSDYTLPRAKRVIVPRTGKSRFVWYRRLKKRPWAQVQLVPFGSAQR